jgi:hypothetical protein
LRRVAGRPLSSRSTIVTLYDRFTLETGYSAIHPFAGGRRTTGSTDGELELPTLD